MKGVMFVMLFFISSCKAQDKVTFKTSSNANTLLWQISGKGIAAPSYLFGTFHLICKEDIPFGKQLKQAVQATTEIYMELDMDDPATVLGGLKYMNMRDDSTLKKLYSEAEYNKLAAFFKDSMQLPLAMFQHMKPFFVSALLYPKMLACKTTGGVEDELVKLAREYKKQVQGLETMAFQASVFDSIPYVQQGRELLKMVDSIAAYRQYFEGMVKVYKSQQLKEIEDMLASDKFAMEENQDILLNKRNANWVLQLNTIMKKQPVFIAVGAGHLVGEKGLISLLKQEGYTVIPIEN